MTAPGNEPLHPTVLRVVLAAASGGPQIEVVRFPAGTRTAKDAAGAVGCEVGQIVKSLVFVVDGDPVVALVSGADRLDPARLTSAACSARPARAAPSWPPTPCPRAGPRGSRSSRGR